MRKTTREHVLRRGEGCAAAHRSCLVATGVVAGTVVGKVLAERVSERWARSMVLLLALAGGLTTLVKGLWSL